MTAIKSDISLISLVCQSKPTVLYQLWHKGGKEEADLKENEIKAFLKGKTSRRQNAVDFYGKDSTNTSCTGQNKITNQKETARKLDQQYTMERKVNSFKQGNIGSGDTAVGFNL